MKFEGALELLSGGGKVRRRCWDDRRVYYKAEIDVGENNVKQRLAKYKGDEIVNHDVYLSYEDIWADDWEEVIAGHEVFENIEQYKRIFEGVKNFYQWCYNTIVWCLKEHFKNDLTIYVSQGEREQGKWRFGVWFEKHCTYIAMDISYIRLHLDKLEVVGDDDESTYVVEWSDLQNAENKDLLNAVMLCVLERRGEMEVTEMVS